MNQVKKYFHRKGDLTITVLTAAHHITAGTILYLYYTNFLLQQGLLLKGDSGLLCLKVDVFSYLMNIPNHSNVKCSSLGKSEGNCLTKHY